MLNGENITNLLVPLFCGFYKNYVYILCQELNESNI